MSGMNLLAFAAVLLMTVVGPATAQPSFIRRAVLGDSCKYFTYTSDNIYFKDMLSKMHINLPCPDFQVVNANGDCVPRDSSAAVRCQDPLRFNFANFVAFYCNDNPEGKYADPLSCGHWYDCAAGFRMPCPSGKLYDDALQECRPKVDVMCNQRLQNYTSEEIDAICAKDPTRMINTVDCNNYYNCTKRNQVSGRTLLNDFENECPYLELYDTELKECRPFSEVMCEARREMSKCALKKSACTGSNCRSCEEASCVNKEDGPQAKVGREFSPIFVECHKGKDVKEAACEPKENARGIPEPHLFHPVEKKCVTLDLVPRMYGGSAPDS